MDLNIKNKKALVCGSTQGIGKETAKILANEGVKVTLVARNEERLKSVLSELSNSNEHNYIIADFNNPSDLKSKIEDDISKNGGFHILINNTGGPPSGKIEDSSLEQFETAFTQHLKCNHILAVSFPIP